MFRKIDLKRATYVGVDKRVAPRSDCYCRLAVTMPDLLQKLVTITNISADGLQFFCDRHLEPEDKVVIKLPLLAPTKAHVIWSLGNKTGVEFDESVAASDYLPLLRALGVRPADQ